MIETAGHFPYIYAVTSTIFVLVYGVFQYDFFLHSQQLEEVAGVEFPHGHPAPRIATLPYITLHISFRSSVGDETAQPKPTNKGQEN